MGLPKMYKHVKSQPVGSRQQGPALPMLGPVQTPSGRVGTGRSGTCGYSHQAL